MLPSHFCCLCSWWVSSGQRQRQQKSCFSGQLAAFALHGFHRVRGGGSKNLASQVCLLPLLLMNFIGSTAEAAKILLLGSACCLCSWWVSSGQRQRQQKSCFSGLLAAFGLGELHRVNGRGSRNSASQVCLLPLVLVSFIGSTAEAAEILLLRSACCL